MYTLKLTESEASSLKDYIETYLIQSIKDDEEVDSLLYVRNIISIYERLGGFDQYADYIKPAEYQDESSD